MLIEEPGKEPRSAHVIVVGNEKGGSGKSTICMHIAVALLQAGQRVATFDLASRQKSLTRCIENRRAWAVRTVSDLPIPTHYLIAGPDGAQRADKELEEFSAFNHSLSAAQHTQDFVVIDTPSTDNYISRLAHSLADTLVMPVNDSFVDFDVLGAIDPVTLAVTGTSHYAEMMREARRQRRLVDGKLTDWVVLHNRMSAESTEKPRIARCVQQLASQLGFRVADGLRDRPIYREFFPQGLTALDDLQEAALGARPDRSYLPGREDVERLVESLRLPLNERRHRRAVVRAQWIEAAGRPVETDDILAQ